MTEFIGFAESPGGFADVSPTNESAAAEVAEGAGWAEEATVQETETQQLPTGDRRTGAAWQEHFGTKVVDPDGWRAHKLDFATSEITKEEFAELWSCSTCVQPPPPELMKLLRHPGFQPLRGNYPTVKDMSILVSARSGSDFPDLIISEIGKIVHASAEDHREWATALDFVRDVLDSLKLH